MNDITLLAGELVRLGTRCLFGIPGDGPSLQVLHDLQRYGCTFYPVSHEATEQFDLVLMCQTIDHLFDLRKSLSRVRDVFRPEGFFFCDIVDFEEV